MEEMIWYSRKPLVRVVALGALAVLIGACGQSAEDAAAGAPAGQADREQEGLASLPSVTVSKVFRRLSFRRPVFLTHAGDGTDRLFVVEQRGTIRVFEAREAVEESRQFLDIRSKVAMRHNEEGLLALAFHPRYEDNGHFFVYYSARNPRRGVLSRFSVATDAPDRADPESERVILEVRQPWGNHNGSTVLFGPDGYLYISLGDGGKAGDPLGSGQDLTTLLGTILRIDVDRQEDDLAYAIPKDNPFVDRPEARGEIWAYGLRNVWRMSFDRKTGDLWAGDVGQNAYEEIDLIVKGGNYGWNIREGSHPFSAGSSPDPLIDPVVEYPQRRGRKIIGLSVTGGYVYRGDRTNGLEGAYIYADYVTGRIWALRYDGGKVVAQRQIFSPSRSLYISSFGEGPDGELYICAFDRLNGRPSARGRLYRMVER